MKTKKHDEPLLPEVRVEPDARRTKEYLRYIIGEIFKSSPLEPRKVVTVDILEGSDHFPEIAEFIVGPTGNNTNVIEKLSDKYWTDSYPKERIAVANQLANKEWRGQAKLSELERFTKKAVRNWSPLQNYRSITDSPLHVSCEFIVGNPEKLLEEAQVLKVAIPPELIVIGLDHLGKARFVDALPAIKWGHVVIKLEQERLDTDICREAFKVGPLAELSWYAVLEKVDHVRLEKRPEAARKAVADAVRRLNKLTKAHAGKELFVWTDRAFYRIA